MPRWFAFGRYVLHIAMTLVIALGVGGLVLTAAIVATNQVVGIRPEAMGGAILFGATVVLIWFVPDTVRVLLRLNPPPPRPSFFNGRLTWLEGLHRRRLLQQIRRYRRRRRVDGRFDRLGNKLADLQARVALRIPGSTQSLVAIEAAGLHDVLSHPVLTQHYHHVLERSAPQARRPLRLDASTLSPAARRLFLGALIGAGENRTPDRLAAHDPKAGSLTYASATRAIDIMHWRKAAPTIAALLGQTYQVIERDGVSLELLPLARLPDVILFTSNDHRAGEILFGYDLTTGNPQYLSLSTLTHTLVTGPSGMGKSTFANLLICQLVKQADICAELVLVDLKDGVEFARYAGPASTVTLVERFEDLVPVLQRLEALMAERLIVLKAAGRTTWQGAPVIVIVDEFAHIALHPSPERKAVLEAFTRIGNQARAVGIHLIVQVQHAVAETLPTALRRNLVATVSFRQPSAQAAATLLGDAQELPADITRLRRGQFIYRTGRTAETFALHAPVVDSGLTSELVSTGQKRPTISVQSCRVL